MRILCVCDQGNSRSPTIASLLRYHGHDTIPVGANRAGEETRRMLADWCELAIFTDPAQRYAFPTIDDDRATVWPIADAYPRPFNKDLHGLVLRLIASDPSLSRKGTLQWHRPSTSPANSATTTTAP